MPEFTTRPELIGTFGVAASTHWLASQAAMRMLEIGGNAFDAAVAGGLVLHVAEPHLNGPFGDVPIILHDASDRRTQVICGQGPAPAAATIETMKARGVGDVIPGNGLLPAAVPGAMDAWLTLLENHGRLDLQAVLEPAIFYAGQGVPLVSRVCELIAANATMFRDHWLTSAALYLPGGAVPEPGSLFRNVAWAGTLRRLLDATAQCGSRTQRIRAARTLWAEGFVAEAIDDWCRTAEAMDQTGRPNRALLTGADMAAWRASYEEPVHLDYAGRRVLKCGPWSQGPVMLQALSLLAGFDIESMDPNGDEFVHCVVEAMKLAYADRDTFYGDPTAGEVPLDRLLGGDYATARRRLIGEDASRDYRPGEIDGFGLAPDYEAAIARRSIAEVVTASGGGEPTTATLPPAGSGPRSGDTCYLTVIDRDGNMVSATPSGGWLTSSPVIPSLGFPLGTRLQMAWLDPRSPAALRPGMRPRTTLTPTMVLRDDGAPCLCVGTPGGDGQDQWQTIFLLRHFHHGLNLQEAIDAPSFHSTHWPSSFYPREAYPAGLTVEGRFSPQVLDRLRARGHDITVGGNWSEGRLAAASRAADGILRAAANPRGMQGYAVGR